MSIGSTIKKLRRERDMTQEQLAEYLGITANAVSQWECDRTSPDISQLPVLANIFRVSADIILEIDVGFKDAKINKIYEEARELWCTGRRSEAEKLFREGIAQFPDAYILMEELAFNLSYSSKREDREESIKLFERIRAGAVNENTKNFAIGNLCDLYMKMGNPEKAKELAMTIPVFTYTREACLRMTMRGKEWADDVRLGIYSSFNSIVWDLRNLMVSFKGEHPLFTSEEIISLWQKSIDLVKVFYEDKDYGFDEQLLIEAHFHMARLYAKLGEVDSSMKQLEKMVEHIENYDNYSDGLIGDFVVIPPEKWQTSLLVRPLGPEDSRLVTTVSTSSTENAAMDYLRQLADNDFDAVRSISRFRAIEERLKLTAKE